MYNEELYESIKKLTNVKSYIYTQLTSCRDINLSNDYVTALNTILSVLQSQHQVLFDEMGSRMKYNEALVKN
jgi:flagellar biosynthesis/type III secretory pathway chaperone